MSERSSSPERFVFGAFLLLTASLAVQKPSIISTAGKPLSASDLIFPPVLLATVALLAKDRRIVWKTAYWSFMAYAAAFILAASFAPDRIQSFTKTAATIYLVLIAAVAIEVIDTPEKLRLTILVFLCASVIPILIGIATVGLFYADPQSSLLPYLTTHYGAVPVGNYPRLSSTFSSASMFCNYLNVVLMVLLIGGAKEWVNKKLFVIGIAAVLICAVFTVSSGLGAVVLALGLWYWNTHRKTVSGRFALSAGIVACLLFLATGFIALQKHSTAPYAFQIPFAGIETYPSPRLLVWAEAANNFLSNVLVGSGPGSRSASVVFQNTEGTYSLLTDAHNTFLSVATQTGMFGLLALITLTGYLIKAGFRRYDDPLIFGLAVAFFTTFVIQGLMGSFEDARHLWLVIGLLVAAIRIKEKGSAAEFGSGA